MGVKDPIDDLYGGGIPKRGSRQERIIALKCIHRHSTSRREFEDLAQMLDLGDVWKEAVERGAARQLAG